MPLSVARLSALCRVPERDRWTTRSGQVQWPRGTLLAHLARSWLARAPEVQVHLQIYRSWMRWRAYAALRTRLDFNGSQDHLTKRGPLRGLLGASTSILGQAALCQHKD